MNAFRRNQLPLAIGVAVVVVVAVVAAIVGLGSLGSSPTSSASASVSLAPTSSPTDQLSTPEGATRAFYAAIGQAREHNDPSAVTPFVTSTASSAYMTVSSFVDGQAAVGKASVRTVFQMANVKTEIQGATATVTFMLTDGGYDVDAKTGKPLESPTVLSPTPVTVHLDLVGARWLVDSFVEQVR